MAQSVIGALRVNLGLDSAKFDSGSKRAGKSLQRMRKHFMAVAGTAAALGTAIGAAALKGAQEIDRAAKAARRLDASIGGFRALELAASEAGVSLSGLTNDVQNMAREIANIGTSGNADRALKRLGIAVSDLTGLDADQRVALIADRVKALGLSAGAATAVLRDLGVRNREMALLMIQGGDAIRAARADVDEYGLALDAVDAARIEQANDRLGRLGLISQYAGQQLALALVPAMGRLAQVMTDSLREGGMLRSVIDGLVGNLDRLTAYVSVAVAAFGVRYVGALALARLSTLTLAGSLALLRTALIRTGIGALIVAAGEMVLWFGRLVTATGGWGDALALLGDVAGAVWQGIIGSAEAIPPGLQGVWNSMQAGFLKALSAMASKFHDFVWTLASGMQSNPLTAGLGDSLMGLAETASGLSGSLMTAGHDADGAASTSYAEAAGIIKGAFGPAREAVARLRDTMAGVKAETASTTSSVEAMNEALGDEGTGTGGGGGSGVGGGGGTKGKLDGIATAAEGAGSAIRDALVQAMDEAKQKTEQTADTIRGSLTDAFKGIVTGASSMRDAVSGVLSQLSDMLLTNVGNWMFSGISASMAPAFAGIPGFANGTDNAPGGLAWVGERGRELVNLPRGSQVIPNHKLSSSQRELPVRLVGGDLVLGDGGQIMTTISARIDRASSETLARTPAYLDEQRLRTSRG